MFIEDVDCVRSEDVENRFYENLAKLVLNSKTPIILSTSDVNNKTINGVNVVRLLC